MAIFEPFARPADMENRFDSRTLKDLLLDTGEAETNLSTNMRMETALMDATGNIVDACNSGKIYDVDDLVAIKTSDDADGHVLKRICCELALVYLIEARPEKFKGQYAELTRRTEGYLDRFRKGERVFSITANKDAGVVSHAGLDRYQYPLHGNWIPDRMRGFYPPRALPSGR